MSSKVIQPGEELIQTVRIECTLPSGKLSVGTGFPYVFLTRKIGDNTNWGIRTIVTNKHVIQHNGVRVKSGHFCLNKRDARGKCSFGSKVLIEFKGEEWIEHPSNDVDLSVLPVSNYIDKLEQKGEKLFFVNGLHEIVPANDIGWSRIGPLEDIVTVGYPNGLWDEENNIPIARKGITASYPNLNYLNKEQFVVDMPIYPGISGSPVFAMSYGQEDYESGGWGIGGKCLLIGILYAGLRYKEKKPGADLSVIPTDDSRSDPYELMSNLGVAIKSTKLKDFENVFVSRLDDEDKKYLKKADTYEARRREK